MLITMIDITFNFVHHRVVRTTLNLDDDVLAEVKDYAENRSQPLGKAVSELVRRGLAARRPTRRVNGLLVFDVPPGSARVSTELVRRIEADEDERLPAGR